MEKLSWEERVLRPRLDKLYELRKSANGESLIRINKNIEIILDELAKDEISDDSFDELAYEMYKIKTMKSFMRIIRDFVIDYSYYPRIERAASLGKRGQYEILHEFFSMALDPDLFKIFMSIFRYRDSNIHDAEYDGKAGRTIYLPYFDEVHIGINRNYTIEDLVTLGHEYGHGIEFKTNYRENMCVENEMFMEVVSKFFELLLLDFLKGRDMFSRAAMEYQQRTYFFDCFAANAILVENYMFKKWSKDKSKKEKVFYKMMKSDFISFREYLFSELEEPSVEALVEKKYHFNGKYIVSESLAIDLFILYLHDRDRALEKLHEYLSLDTGVPSIIFLEELRAKGFTFNECLEEYSEYLNDEKRLVFR